MSLLAEHSPSLDPSDHRAIAARLDLLHFQDHAPGMVFWHPNGWLLYRLLEDAARRHVEAGGYREVRTPQLVRRALWEASGHWDHFAGGMFAFDPGGPAAAALKPVSCPGHVQIVKRAAPSWRDLPLRLAEMGLVHRDEESGALHGLFRLRQFTQDDGHIFCADDPAQVAVEIERFCRDVGAFYRGFGFDPGAIEVALATRPADRAGDDAWWDRAEAELEAAARAAGMAPSISPGGGAFYGPKLELGLRDRRGRLWQCGTIQHDLVMPRRFELQYVDAGGARRHTVMLHRALFGSIERFLGILLEHHGAALPAWLAPVQVAVLPVGADQRAAAAAVAAELARAGLRARVDADDSLARRIAIAHDDGVAVVAVIGAREVADGTVALRRGADRRTLPVAAAVAELVAACAPPWSHP
jgi:threonyl-tRNA synthetase